MSRVAHLAPATLPVLTTTGGALQRRIVAMATEQAVRGEVVVYSLPGPDAATPFRVVHVPCRLPRPWRDLEFLLRVQLRLRRDGIGVVHSHAVPLAGLLVGVRTVLTVDYSRFRGWDRWLPRAVYRRALRRCARVVAVSEYCLRQFEEVWGPDLRTSVIGNGVDVATYRPDEERGSALRRRLGVADDEVVLAYVGRRSEQKGTDLLMEAFRRLAAAGGVRLLLAGPDGDFDRVLAASQTANSRWSGEHGGGGVLALGAVEDALLPAVFNAADLAVLPTRRDEMFGMAIVEAQASGLSALASDSQGLLETVDPGSGWLFETGDVESLLRAAREAVALGRQELRSRGGSARRFASRFAWPRVVEAYDAVYAEARGD